MFWNVYLPVTFSVVDTWKTKYLKLVKELSQVEMFFQWNIQTKNIEEDVKYIATATTRSINLKVNIYRGV